MDTYLWAFVHSIGYQVKLNLESMILKKYQSHFQDFIFWGEGGEQVSHFPQSHIPPLKVTTSLSEAAFVSLMIFVAETVLCNSEVTLPINPDPFL